MEGHLHAASADRGGRRRAVQRRLLLRRGQECPAGAGARVQNLVGTTEVGERLMGIAFGNKPPRTVRLSSPGSKVCLGSGREKAGLVVRSVRVVGTRNDCATGQEEPSLRVPRVGQRAGVRCTRGGAARGRRGGCCRRCTGDAVAFGVEGSVPRATSRTSCRPLEGSPCIPFQRRLPCRRRVGRAGGGCFPVERRDKGIPRDCPQGTSGKPEELFPEVGGIPCKIICARSGGPGHDRVRDRNREDRHGCFGRAGVLPGRPDPRDGADPGPARADR